MAPSAYQQGVSDIDFTDPVEFVDVERDSGDVVEHARWLSEGGWQVRACIEGVTDTRLPLKWRLVFRCDDGREHAFLLAGDQGDPPGLADVLVLLRGAWSAGEGGARQLAAAAEDLGVVSDSRW